MDAFVGEIRWFGFDYAPEDWALCDGSVLDVAQHQALYSIIGNRFGGVPERTFGLPNLIGRAARGIAADKPATVTGAPAITPAGQAETGEVNRHLVLNPCICLNGEYPIRPSAAV